MDIQTVIKAIPGVTEPQAEKLCRYYEMLMDWPHEPYRHNRGG